MVIEKCYPAGFELEYTEKKIKLGGESFAFRIPDKCIFTKPVSVHTPIQRFVTDLLVCFDNCLGLTNRALERLETHRPLIETVDPVLTTMAVLAQTKIGNPACLSKDYDDGINLFFYRHVAKKRCAIGGTVLYLQPPQVRLVHEGQRFDHAPGGRQLAAGSRTLGCVNLGKNETYALGQ